MLFARGAEKWERPEGRMAGRVFRCAGCGAPLELERVAAADVERKRHGVTGWVTIRHSCPCTPSGPRADRSWGTHAAFCALFGSQPWLPYRAPFRVGDVTEDEPATRRWQWELEQVADVDEFLLFLDDARDRQRRQP